MKKKIIEWLKAYIYIPACIAVAYLLVGVIFIYAIVPTPSMEPNFQVSHIYIGIRLVDKENIQRCTPVFFKFGKSVFLKRVIGLPGDTVSIKGGSVYINGELLDESEYLPAGTTTISPRNDEFHVPESCYFMLGDNRGNSDDSRYWENPFVSCEAIVGIPFHSRPKA